MNSNSKLLINQFKPIICSYAFPMLFSGFSYDFLDMFTRKSFDSGHWTEPILEIVGNYRKQYWKIIRKSQENHIGKSC